MAPPKGKKPAARSAIADTVSREYTIHLHKRVCTASLLLFEDILTYQLHGTTFKQRAPKAIKCIKEFAQKSMVGKLALGDRQGRAANTCAREPRMFA
jgi:large subunit ribosomal protein L31e